MIFNKHFGCKHIELAPPKRLHIEWNSNFGLKCHFAHFFKKIQERSPYIYAFVGCNKSVCDQVICDAYDKRITEV
jgi:hypothetical protein